MNTSYSKEIDALIQQFWKKGYMTVSRKFGKYLPDPSPIGGFDVDVIARYKNTYAIGIVIKENDLANINQIKDKIVYLASRQTKYGNKPVNLYIGVSSIYFFKVNQVVSALPEKLRKNIFITQLFENDKSSNTSKKQDNNLLFS
jgi:hypothetical protein